MLGVVQHTRLSSMNRTHNTHAITLARLPGHLTKDNIVVLLFHRVCHLSPEFGTIWQHLQVPSNIFFFFGKCFKKTTEYFFKLLFLFETTILPVTNGK